MHPIAFIYLIISATDFVYASVDLKDFYPFGELNGDTVLPRGENQCDSVNMKVPFYDGVHALSLEMYISTNGIITSNKLYCSYTNGIAPKYVTISDSAIIIAPFFTLTSTAIFGTVLFRETYDADILNRVNRDISDAGLLSYKATNALIATWIDVTFAAYNGAAVSTPKNSFQVVVTSDGFYTFAIYYFSNITWNQGDYTGDCSGNKSTGVGNYCNAFTGYKVKTIYWCPSYCTDSLFLRNSSNVNRPGVWLNRVYFANKPISSLEPSYVDMMGHRSINIIIPDSFNNFSSFVFESNARNISTCYVVNTSNNETKLSCFVLFSTRYGTSYVGIFDKKEHFFFYYATEFMTSPVPEVSIKVLNMTMFNYSVSIELKWNAPLIAKLNPGCETVNITMHVFEPDERIWDDHILILENVINSGGFDITLVEPNIGLFVSKHLIFGVTGNSGSNITGRNTIFSKMFIFDLDSFNLKRKVQNSGDANVLATVDMMGHGKLNISFPTTPGQDGLGCQFQDFVNNPITSAIASSNNQNVICYVPFLYSYGVTEVRLFAGYYPGRKQEYYDVPSRKIRANTIRSETQAYFKYGDSPLMFNIDVLPSYPRLFVEQVGIPTESAGQLQAQMQFTWDPNEIPIEYPVLNAFIYQFDDDQNQWMKELMVSPQYIPPNAGSASVTLSQDAITVFFNCKVMFGLGYVQGDENFVIFSKMYIPGASK